jgi:hypothetical protein
MNLKKAEFMQYLNPPLSRDPAGKTWPRWLSPCLERTSVRFDDVRGLEGPHETQPSRPAVELIERCEERPAGSDVDVEARLLVVPVFVGEGKLGPVGLRDAVLLGSQLPDRFGVLL